MKPSGIPYQSFKKDPSHLRMYTLKNGFRVYLSKNTDEPKIHTRIAVRAGSNYDPKETTGLAHYLEHMLFKGTQKYGTSNWEKEREILNRISSLFELRRHTKDPVKKASIYREIDKLSVKASEYAIANEYDKMAESIGAEKTNAHTWYEETVFKDLIPANELERWAILESERFSNLVLRLFHTELETVYEEFNRAQDNDARKKLYQTLEGLFPNHPYGQQTTIGKPEHLKNPSMKAIHRFFKTYYVPSNMAIILVGDLDFDKSIAVLEATFGTYDPKPIQHLELPQEKPILKPVIREVYGPTSESVYVAFRVPAIGTPEALKVKLIDKLLSNFQAGLFDLHLNQKQKLQRAVSFTLLQNDYGVHFLDGYPLQGQSLEEVKTLMLEQLERIKNGDFDDWLLQAVVNDMKLKRITDFESPEELADAFTDAFVHKLEWQDVLHQVDEMQKISKDEISAFARKFYTQNYVVTYKRKGVDTQIAKVENPKITPVKLNRDRQSGFMKRFLKIPARETQPVFIDYQKEIKSIKLNEDTEISFIPNTTNSRFSLSFIIDYGIDHDKKLVLACSYLNYIGTSKFTPEELKIEFYKIGITYKVEPRNDRTLISLSGLQENLSAGLELFTHFWNEAKADAGQYQKFVQKINRSRNEIKSKKDNILWSGLYNYAKFGEHSRFRNIFSLEALQEIDPEELVFVFKKLKQLKKSIFFYGKNPENMERQIHRLALFSDTSLQVPLKFKYTHRKTGKNVFFTHYDMVQAEIVLLAKHKQAHLDINSFAHVLLFNTYFGSGLSSIIFQELRESRSLAYSTFASYLRAHKKANPDYVVAYIGTQANKLQEAVHALDHLLREMPVLPKQFEQAREAALKRIASERITKERIFWNYLKLNDQGFNYDIRRLIYDNLQRITIADLKQFFEKHIARSAFDILIIGNKKEIDFEVLNRFGKLLELDTDYLFNYREAENHMHIFPKKVVI